jgi:hypothetical protein
MVEVENDSLLLKRDDRFYTAGDHLSRRFMLQSGTQVVEYGWRLGQDLYTGSDIKLPPAQMPVIDHPYAAWLYGGVWREQTDATGRSWKIGLDIGCLGPCAAGEKSQEILHKILRQPQAQGWSTQLKNEAGVVLSGSYSPGKMLPWTGVEFRPLVKGRFGNIFTDAGIEAELRAGNLNLLPGQQASYAFCARNLNGWAITRPCRVATSATRRCLSIFVIAVVKWNSDIAGRVHSGASMLPWCGV